MQMFPLASSLVVLATTGALAVLAELSSSVGQEMPPPEYNHTGSFCGWNGVGERWEIYSRGWGRSGSKICAKDFRSKLSERCNGTEINRWKCLPPPPSAKDERDGAWFTFHFDAFENEAYKLCVEKAYWQASLYEYEYPGERIECCRNCHRYDDDWPPG